MQPLAYFAARSLLGWLQWVEGSDRAFVSNPLLLIATGAAHCWAVVYALFIAIHTRAMRYDGYHEGYTEHLPIWVSWTETLSVASMGIWWAAGFTTAAIRIIDDDARGLPMESGELKPNIFVQIMRSPRLHDGLAMAHTLSCVGLFLSILLLCVAMAMMKGDVTHCELCLCFVAVGFALPHAVVAARRLNFSDPKKTEALEPEPAPAAEAAAQEASSLGPQLCVLLALADSPGHAYMWQNMVYLTAAFAFVAAVAACGRSPPKVGNAALPPETGEFITCLVLDIAASVALVKCFPHLNTWHLWALSALLVALFVAIYFKDWRDMFIDLLDPLFVTRSDTDKVLPGKQRETLRRVAWAATIACSFVAMWDILMHPVQEGLFEVPHADDDGLHQGLNDLWDHNKMMMFRWKDTADGSAPGESLLLSAVAESLSVDQALLESKATFAEHRLMLFQYKGQFDKTQRPAHARWQQALDVPEGKVSELAESFPSTLNISLCLHVHASAEIAKQKAEEEKKEGKTVAADQQYPEELAKAVGTDAATQKAYMAGCSWWTDTLDSYYSSAGETHEEAMATAEVKAQQEIDEESAQAAELATE